MRIIVDVKNQSAQNAQALYEKVASTLTETRVARVYAEEIDNYGVVDSYRIEWIIHRPNAGYGEAKCESHYCIHSSAADMRAWLHHFFAPVELTDADPRPSVE